MPLHQPSVAKSAAPIVRRARLRRHAGPDASQKAYDALATGRMDPAEGHVLSLQ